MTERASHEPPAVTQAFTDLGTEADTARLATAGDVRRRGDRRTRVQLVVGMMVIALVVAGVTAGTQWLVLAGPDRQPHPAITPTTTAGPTTSPSPSPSTPPDQPVQPVVKVGPAGAIPAAAFLQSTTEADGGVLSVGPFGSDQVVPELCGASFPSYGSIRARAQLYSGYYPPGRYNVGPPGSQFTQTITRYDGDGAQNFTGELRSAIAACPHQDRDRITYRHRVLSAPRLGADSILLQVSYPRYVGGNETPAGETETRLVWIVRVRDTVLVLYEHPWEAGWSSGRAIVDRYATAATARLTAWLG